MSKTVRLSLMLAISLALAVPACAAGAITRISDRQVVTLPQLMAVAERSDLILIDEMVSPR